MQLFLACVMNCKIMEKYEQIRNGDDIPRDLKYQIKKLKTEFEMKWSEEDKLVNDNIKNGKKVIGYDKKTFLPIFEKKIRYYEK